MISTKEENSEGERWIDSLEVSLMQFWIVSESHTKTFWVKY